MIKFTYPKWIFNHACGQFSHQILFHFSIDDLSKQNPETTTVYPIYFYPSDSIPSSTDLSFCFVISQIDDLIFDMQSINLFPIAFRPCKTWNLRFSNIFCIADSFILSCSSQHQTWNLECFRCLSKSFYIVLSWKIRDCFCHFFFTVSHQLFAMHNAQHILQKCYLHFSLSDLVAFIRTVLKRNSIFPFVYFISYCATPNIL